MFNGKIHYKWQFSIAFCMFTRGYNLRLTSNLHQGVSISLLDYWRVTIKFENFPAQNWQLPGHAGFHLPLGFL